MMKYFTLLFVCMITAFSALAQPALPTNRSQLTIMVVPYASNKNIRVLDLIESNGGYREAIAVINTALLNMGYKQVVDFQTHMEIVDRRRGFTHGDADTSRMKAYIEDAPVDMLIEAEIIWTDPPGKPTSRQARINLKAVDKYTSYVYANAGVQSYEREFSGLAQAVEHALKKDGALPFTTFLQQLDAQYGGLLTDGRAIKIKFEVAPNIALTLTDRIGMERLSDKIMQCIKFYAFKGQYKVTGESKLYLDFTARAPIIDDKGNSISPSDYFRYQVDQYLFAQGIETEYSTQGPLINFILRSRNR